MIARRLLGSFAVGLGFVGVVIALALVVGVWLTADRVVRAIDRLATSADRGVVRASELLVRVGDRIGTIGDRVRAVPDQLNDLGRRQGGPEEGHAAGLARADALEAASRELESWAARAEQASHRLADASSGLSDLPFSSGVVAESVGGLAGRLDALASALGEAVGELDDLHAALVAVVRTAELPEAARRSVPRLSTATSDRLRAVGDRVEAAQGRFEEIQSGIGDLRQRAHTWVRVTASLLTALLAWLGIGQASLLYLGWKSWRIRAPVQGGG